MATTTITSTTLSVSFFGSEQGFGQKEFFKEKA